MCNITELHRIYPLKVEQHITTNLVNIYTGEEASENVNVTESIKIRAQQMTEFQSNLPERFHERLSSKVITISERKRTKNLKTKTFNTYLIFSRVVYLLSKDQLDFYSFFNYELAPVPTSLFQDTRDASYTSTKSVLQNKLKVEV